MRVLCSHEQVVPGGDAYPGRGRLQVELAEVGQEAQDRLGVVAGLDLDLETVAIIA